MNDQSTSLFLEFHREDSVSFTELCEALGKAGVVAVGATAADRVDEDDRVFFRHWMEKGMNSGMDYMANWPALRFDPREMHLGTRWIISCAFPYPDYPPGAPYIASYALGDDYHKVIPKRIRRALMELSREFSEVTRICVDSAPVRERYWAVRTGIADRCDSGLISIPGWGTRVFLTELLTPWELRGAQETPVWIRRTGTEREKGERCNHCGACRKACPGQAIGSDGTVDARRCLSYLTIEHRGAWTQNQEKIMDTPEGRRTLFGCDICQRVCHLNRDLADSEIPEFRPRPELLALTPESVRQLSPETFANITRNSPIRRSGLDSLRRNAR